MRNLTCHLLAISNATNVAEKIDAFNMSFVDDNSR